MIPRFVVVACLFASAGCVSQSAVVTASDGQKSIQLKRVRAAILAGPCLPPYPGRKTETYWIKLEGDGPTFSIKQLSFVNSKGEAIAASDLLQGEVRLDTTKHLIVVDIHQGDTPMPYNGSYKYKGAI